MLNVPCSPFMKYFLRFLGVCFLFLVLVAVVFVSLYPEATLDYLRRARKKVFRSNIYQNFRAKLPADFGIQGIDVSAYQGEINWEAVRKMKVKKDSITFVFIKATEGTRYFDKYFQHNWRESKRVGILRGAYHYFRPDLGGEAQARYFIQHVYAEAGDLPPVLDIEEVRDTPLPTLRKELRIFLDKLESTYKVTPIIYTNRNFYETYLGSAFKKYPLWIAQYKNLKNSRIKDRNWIFWQHSHEGTVNGINTPVDMNVFEGDLEDLKNVCLTAQDNH